MTQSSFLSRWMTDKAMAAARDVGIPPMPAAVTEAYQEMNRPEPDFVRIAAAVGKDPALSAKVLKVANSPFFGHSMASSSIHQAVVRLGIRGFHKQIVITALKEAYTAMDSGSTDLTNKVWTHLVVTARLAELLALRLQDVIPPEEAYIAGLFHDCAIPMLAKKGPGYLNDYSGLGDNAGNIDLFERERFDTSHAQIAAVMAHGWLLSEEICGGILHHHDVEALTGGRANEVAMARILQMADQLAEAVALICELDSVEYPHVELPDDVFPGEEFLGKPPWMRISVDDLKEIVKATVAEFEDYRAG